MIPKKLKKGDVPTTVDYNNIIDFLKSLDSLSIDGGLIQKGGTRHIIIPEHREEILAVIDIDGRDGTYSWHQVDIGIDGEPHDTEGGYSGFSDNNPLRELNLAAGIAPGTVVRAWRESTGITDDNGNIDDGWRFSAAFNIDTNIVNCGWAAGVKTTTCLRFTRVDATGDCSCGDPDVDLTLTYGVDTSNPTAWATDDVGTYSFSVCGIDLRAVFTPVGPTGPPTLKFYWDVGASEESSTMGVPDGCGTNFNVFAIGPANGVDFCSSGTAEQECADSVVRFKVECKCVGHLHCCTSVLDMPTRLWCTFTDGVNVDVVELRLHASIFLTEVEYYSACVPLPSWLNSSGPCNRVKIEFVLGCNDSGSWHWSCIFHGYTPGICFNYEPSNIDTDGGGYDHITMGTGFGLCPLPLPIYFPMLVPEFTTVGGCFAITTPTFTVLISETHP